MTYSVLVVVRITTTQTDLRIFTHIYAVPNRSLLGVCRFSVFHSRFFHPLLIHTSSIKLAADVFGVKMMLVVKRKPINSLFIFVRLATQISLSTHTTYNILDTELTWTKHPEFARYASEKIDLLKASDGSHILTKWFIMIWLVIRGGSDGARMISGGKENYQLSKVLCKILSASLQKRRIFLLITHYWDLTFFDIF